ncbi:MAG: hypothetical protein GY832_18735, partial [Chloroflexi bacterium]|nr:hypothetical protein [Chloroflexota bacterium]
PQSFDVVWTTAYSGAVAGWHPICAEVDTGEEIEEEIEENNVNCWDLYIFPLDHDLYPTKLTFSDNSPLPDEEITITAEFENRGAKPFTRTDVITFYHGSPVSSNVITSPVPITLPVTIAGHMSVSVTKPITWTTYNSHGTAYIYVEYIKKYGTYNLSPPPRRLAQRLNIRKNPSPDLRVRSGDIDPGPQSFIPYGQVVSVSVDVANISPSPIATATNFIVEFHISGPNSGYQQLGQAQTIASLGPRSMTTTVHASEFQMADKFYAIQVSVWPRIEQGDRNYGDNEATTTILKKGFVILDLIRTVGTQAGVCASSDAIIVTPGTPVYYCYQMKNRADVFLDTHDLIDEQLGHVLSGYAYDLSPDETF